MGKHLTYKDTKNQSLAVFGQFGEKVWIPNAKENAKLDHKDSNTLQNMGLGKILVIVAMGASLEDHIDTIKKYRGRFDLMCCDKAFVPLMEHGVKPDMVMICDANIPARHFETHVHATKDIKLFATPYANTLWTKSWLGDRYFFVNKDAINTEDIFMPIMGKGTRTIPASSNVSNAMVVFMNGSDETRRVNWGGYEKYLLVGYDYSWRPDGNYYAWSNPKPKRNYMHHVTCRDIQAQTVFTSGNLLFSARWLFDYCSLHKLPVTNCSGRGLLDIPFKSNLEKELASISADQVRVGAVRSTYRVLQSIKEAELRAQEMFQRAREAICQ